jgi:hypothetical protein
MSVARKIPKEVVKHILDYCGIIDRNGKLIYRLEKNDKRYDLLRTIPEKIYQYSFTQVNFHHRPFSLFRTIVVRWRELRYVTWEYDIYNYSHHSIKRYHCFQ